MPQPGKSSVHVNKPLTNISIAYLQSEGGFIADKMFPSIPVKKQSDRYFTYNRGDMNRDEMEIRAPGTESAGGEYNVDNTPTYFAHRYSFHFDITEEDRTNSDTPLEADTDATMYVTNKARLKREGLFMDKFVKAGVWDTDVTGVSGTPSGAQFKQWDQSDSTPIEDLRGATTDVGEATGFRPNTLLIQQHVLDALMDHPDIVDRVKYGQTSPGPATVGIPELQALFKIPRILVMSAIRNTAAKGATEASSFIGGKHALLCYAAPRPGRRLPSAGYTFSWTGLLGNSAMGHRIKKFHIDAIESDRIEIDMAFDQKVVGSDLGYFFSGAVA